MNAPQALSPQVRAALAWAHGARFVTTASRLDQLPVHDAPEIAFVGRSNAGKSTAINTLAQHRRLAFASRRRISAMRTLSARCFPSTARARSSTVRRWWA